MTREKAKTIILGVCDPISYRSVSGGLVVEVEVVGDTGQVCLAGKMSKLGRKKRRNGRAAAALEAPIVLRTSN